MKLALIIVSVALPVVAFLSLATGYALGLQRGYRHGVDERPWEHRKLWLVPQKRDGEGRAG